MDPKNIKFKTQSGPEKNNASSAHFGPNLGLGPRIWARTQESGPNFNPGLGIDNLGLNRSLNISHLNQSLDHIPHTGKLYKSMDWALSDISVNDLESFRGQGTSTSCTYRKLLHKFILLGYLATSANKKKHGR